MAREKEGYRNQLEALILHFGADAGMVTQKQVAAYLGRSDKWVRTHLQVRGTGITLPLLADRLVSLCAPL